MVAAPSPTPCTNVGFLSVHQEPTGFVGGYLVTNAWGRPLEFRLSSAVQPNKVQTILYGDSLGRYLCGDVIGKTLLDKTTTPVQWLLVDNPLTLDLRLRIEMPIALWYSVVDPDAPMPGLMIQSRLYCHTQFPDDVETLRQHLDKLGQLDFAEPFTRIREALNEARKMGVTRSAAA
ncbi:MAG: hypothetical protein HY289_13415 [Planctomycetes bacterium]|nr:hypothetical protein [Planctomycetota bacterium]